jgi:hypothetical protein
VAVVICIEIPKLWSQFSTQAHPTTMADQLATEDRVRKPGWWPTKGSFPRSAYLGDGECARCHVDIVSAQKASAMAQAVKLSTDSEHLTKHPRRYKLGPYSYQAARNGQTANYSVTDGTASFSAPLQWAFGIRMGQSFLFEKNGGIFMAPLTYYPEAGVWDFTVDQPHSVPESFDKAIGRHLTDSEVQGCFNCHNTASTTNNRFDPEHSTPGITCEACHGPGADHIVAVKAGLADQGTTMILNPRHINHVEAVDFCGA